MKRILSLLLALALCASCAKKSKRDYEGAKDDGKPQRGGTFVDSSMGSPDKLNPVIHGDAVSGLLCDLMFNGLVKYNEKLVLEGDLAESWKVEQGGRKITFKLRKGVKWHDGKPLTSRDVRFSWKVIMDPRTATPRKGDYELVQSVDTPDEHTVVVHYKKPFARALPSWGLGVIPEHLLSGVKDINSAEFNRKPVGTGPFRFKEWVDKQYVRLEANPDYFEGRPNVDSYVMRLVPDQSTQLLEFRSESLDQIELNAAQYALETDTPEFKRIANKYRFDGWRTYIYMGFNFKNEIFKDVQVRRALSHAIDREQIIKGVLQGLGKPCSGPYVPVMPAYNSSIKPVAHDLKLAASLLDKAGWVPGKDGVRMKGGKALKFRLLTNQGNETRKKIVLILQQQFEKIGAKAEVEMYEWSTFISKYINKRDFDAAVLGWQLSLDPDLHDMWHSSRTGEEEFNFISYSNKEVDALLEKGRSELSDSVRLPIYRRVHQILAEEQPYCFLYAPDSLMALNKRIRGVKEYSTGVEWHWTRDWYIPQSLQP